jgi:hypothetical protein
MRALVKIKRYFRTRPFMFLIDVSGILLFLILAVCGIIIITVPYWLFLPFVPMLTPRDWPIAEEQLEIKTLQNEFEQQQRYFLFRIHIEEPPGERVSIYQRFSWYADTVRARERWQIDTAAAANPYTVTFSGATQPTHLFSCRRLEADQRSCDYYAYDDHWYVKVGFSSNNETRLTLKQMEQLAGLIGERLTAMTSSD